MDARLMARRLPLIALIGGFAGCIDTTVTPNLAGQDVHLTVVHTADLHSRFFPYYFAPGQIDKGLGLIPKPGRTTAVVGGIARIARVVKCIRGIYSGVDCDGITEIAGDRCPTCTATVAIAGEPAERSIHLDSGDIFEGAPVFNQFNGEVEMRAMSGIGLTAMALGNHEFDKGSVNLELQKQRFGGFPILAANYLFSDPNDYTQPKLGRLIHPYTIVNVGGMKIGIIGLGNLSSIQGIIEGGNSLGVRPLEATQAISDTVNVVRTQVDSLFIVSHLGLDEDEGVAAADAAGRDQNAAVALNGVDAIFGGHLHIVLNPPKDLPHFDDAGQQIGHTVLCHSGAFAKYVGRLDLVIHMPTDAEKEAGVRANVKAYTYNLIPIDDSINSDPDLDNMLEPYQLKLDSFLNLGQVYAIIPCSKNAGTCPKTARNDPNGGDSQLGNLVATAMRLRRRVEADFSLTNSLGIRADFESGPLTLEQMYNVFPFDNTLTTMFLSGDETQQMLDFVASRSSERGCRTQAQVSGIYFDLVCASDDPECNARQDAKGLPHGPCARNIYLGDGCRMPDNTFNGTHCTPIDPFGEYRVAVNDYIAQGGSGFSVLKRNTTKFNTGISLRDALIDYIRTLPSYMSTKDSATKLCDPGENLNVLGVQCKDSSGLPYDCTTQCCCHDQVDCVNSSGQKYDCTNSCSCKFGPGGKVEDCAEFQACAVQGLSPAASPLCGTTCGTFELCQAGGVQCTSSSGTSYDCTPTCGCKTVPDSGKVVDCPEFAACATQGIKPVAVAIRPAPYDFTSQACLDLSVQPHDGRIQTFSGGQ